MVFKRPSRSLEGEKGEFNSHRKTKVGIEGGETILKEEIIENKLHEIPFTHMIEQSWRRKQFQ